MENREFYVKYLDNHAVAIDTSYGRGPDGRLALSTVAHLIGAVKQALPSKLGSIDLDELTLHLPEGVAKDSLEQDCFATVDESDTTLRPSLVLSRLNGLGLDDLNPLVIKSRNGSSELNVPFPPSSGAMFEGLPGSDYPKINRVNLVTQITEEMSSCFSLLITAPSYTGKTSLANLMYNHWKS